MVDVRVAPRCWVVLRFDDDPELFEGIYDWYRRESGEQVVSPDSPVGRAIRGVSPGDTVSVELSGHDVKVTVVAVREAPVPADAVAS